ncbi:MAG: nitrate ABC transporter substrate-binding protein [Gammaproteobacteria bacterium RIFOXYD12_FULL_61_37]|nr:MAG: nitrate ABC transporter substrate-binding protein [Gammaproteobacteria bacterium RIFOXYD12_FULL_61_37]
MSRIASGFLWFCLFLAGLSQALAAPGYVESPPFAQVLAGVPVQEVKTQRPLRVPIITWGGDIATLHANGDGRRTKAGSPFDALGLDLELVRKDVFSEQLKAYLEGSSPYLRGTLGMINLAAEALSRDPRTKPVVIYQMTWSAGGDALVVKPGIHAAKDLRGKTIALQAYGPHVDYLTKILADAGLSPRDVKLRWLPDLTGTENSPAAAFQQPDIDAAFAIIPDATVLTSGGTMGTGAEGSVKGARILLSTRTANRIIADVYAVRSDYLNKNRPQVQAFVQGLLQGQERLQQLARDKAARAAEYRALTTAAAEILLDSPQAVADLEGLYADAEFAGWRGNLDFFTNPEFPRSIGRLAKETQEAFIGLGLLGQRTPLASAEWDYLQLRAGLKAETGPQASRFDQEQVAAVVARKQRQGTLGEGELFSFEIFFKPNQNQFSADLYQESFDKVIEYASTYGGALITVEGHSDPLGYLQKLKEGQPEVVLGRIKQSAKNLSLSRAVAVRDSLIAFAQGKGLTLDATQFAVVGHGIAKPKSGLCGNEPCAPKTEREWHDNMRVEFRVLQVEAESSVFKPL